MTWLYKIEIKNGLNKLDSHSAFADTPEKTKEFVADFVKDYEKNYNMKSYYWNVSFHAEFQKICIDFGSHLTFIYVRAASKELYDKLEQYWIGNKEESKDEEN